MEQNQQPQVRFAHIRHNIHTSIGGGITVAFVQDGPFVKFSTASCAPKVNYNKKIGRQQALAAMDRGEFVKISMSAAQGTYGFWREIKYPKDLIYAIFK